MKTDQLLHRYPIISDQVDRRELRVILLALERQLIDGSPGGAIVEFGCYAGTTSLFVRRLLDAYGSSQEFHVYDSFAGLPEKTAYDMSAAGEQFVAGELAVPRKQFVMNFHKAGLALPTIHKVWFSQISMKEIPNCIEFAFLDGDYFESIRDSLKLITPRLAPGAIIVVDDYANEALPGAARAVDEWRRSHPCQLRVEASLAVLTMP